MIIRRLTVEDLPCCEPFARAFHAEKQLAGAFTLSVFLQNWTTFLTERRAVIFGLWENTQLVGGLGAIIMPDLSDGRLTAQEMFWYVTPDARHGLEAWKLVDAFESWGADHGVEEYRLAHLLLPNEDPASVRLAPLYRRKKYRALEVHYVKNGCSVT